MVALLAFIALAVVYLSFELGRYRAAFSILDYRRETSLLRDRLLEEQLASDELRRQLAIATTAGEIDRQTYSVVEADLSELQAKIQEQEEELVFYRGIVSPQDGVAGLRIQSLEVLPGDGERRYLLRLVLVQAIVHSRSASGTVKMQLDGVLEGQMATLDVADLATDREDYDMDYEFRYFQGLEADLSLPLGFEPQRIHVEIWPDDARAERLTESFEWELVGG